jgi:hypothetical protein
VGDAIHISEPPEEDHAKKGFEAHDERNRVTKLDIHIPGLVMSTKASLMAYKPRAQAEKNCECRKLCGQHSSLSTFGLSL